MSPREITLHGGAFQISGVPTFLYGGEIHYFRLDPDTWGDRLAAAKRLHLNAVSSYIPWIWHEIQEGEFDFEGSTHPRRNLKRFLELVAEHDLLFIARIGPVSNAELVGEGVPSWLFETRPEVQVRRQDGTYLPGMPSYRHPEFLRAVGRWYDALRPWLAPHLLPNGGNIPLIQLCNEIDMPTWLGRQPDYHAHVEAQYGSWVGQPGAGQPDGLIDRWPSSLHTRWMDFYADHFASYARSLQEASASGVPVMVNLAQWTDHYDRGRGVSASMTTMMFRDMARSVPGLVLGGDYYPRRVDFENFHDLVVATELVRMVSGPEAPVVSPELMAGCNEDRPLIYPADVELLLHTSAGHGLNGLNAYMLAGGDNPEGIGLFGTEHDWQAPIGPDGSLRLHHAPLASFGEFLEAHPRFAASQKRLDTHVGFYAPYFQTEYLRGAPIEELENRRVALWHDGMLRLLSLNNLSYGLVDLGRSSIWPDTLWVYAEEWMDRATQRRLADHVLAGKRLVLFPTVPVLDEHGEACTLLADHLEARPHCEATRYVHTEGTRLPVLASARTWARRANDRVLGTTDAGSPCIVSRDIGSGRVLLIGYGMRHRFERQVAIARKWAMEIGVEPHLLIAPGDVMAVTRDDGRDVYLSLLNYHDVPRRVTGTFEWHGERLPISPQAILMERRSALTIRVHHA